MADANKGCYRFETRTYPSALFPTTLDATYVLHLEGNGRLPSINQQLRDIHPTRVLHVLYNKGYKKCKKVLREQISYNDLTDAVITIFRDAIGRGYETVLLLEDDFIFGKNLPTAKAVGEVNQFLEKHKAEDYIYQLGAMPIFRLPYMDTATVSLAGASHANIYSKKCIERLVKAYEDGKITGHIDMYYMKHAATHFNLYTHLEPLVYQTFPQTENRGTWTSESILGKAQDAATNMFISATGLDKHPEPGTSIMYFIAMMLPIVILGLFGGAVYLVWRNAGTIKSAVSGIIRRVSG